MQNRLPRNDIGILERLLAFDRANAHRRGKFHPLLNGRIPLQTPKRHLQSPLNNKENLKRVSLRRWLVHLPTRAYPLEATLYFYPVLSFRQFLTYSWINQHQSLRILYRPDASILHLSHKPVPLLYEPVFWHYAKKNELHSPSIPRRVVDPSLGHIHEQIFDSSLVFTHNIHDWCIAP